MTEIINTEDLLKGSIVVMTASVTITPFAHRLTTMYRSADFHMPCMYIEVRLSLTLVIFHLCC